MKRTRKETISHNSTTAPWNPKNHFAEPSLRGPFFSFSPGHFRDNFTAALNFSSPFGSPGQRRGRQDSTVAVGIVKTVPVPFQRVSRGSPWRATETVTPSGYACFVHRFGTANITAVYRAARANKIIQGTDSPRRGLFRWTPGGDRGGVRSRQCRRS